MSEEQIKARYKARAAIKKVAKQGRTSGTIPCTNCEYGSLRYSVKGSGHVKAKCSTEGCLDWKEKPTKFL